MDRAGWVGLFFFVGLFLLVVLSFKVDDEGHIFKGGYIKQYRTVMPQVGSVGRGSIVRLAGTGIRIGRVDGVELEDLGDRYEYAVSFSIKDDFIIREDSKAQLAMTTLLQGMHLEITPGTPDAAPLDPGSTVATGRYSDLMGTLAGLGETFENLGEGGLGRMLLGAEGYEDIGGILDTLASDGGLGKWVLGESAQKDLEPTIAELRTTVENVRKGTEGEGTIARLLHDKDLGARVDEIIADLREGMKGVRSFAASISEGKGTIARLANDEKLGERVDQIVADVAGVTADLRAGKSLLSKLISDEGLGEKLDVAVTSIADFAQNLATGEGTISRLINDPELYIEVKRLVGQAREAVEDAREAAPISAFTSILFGAVQ